MSSNVPSDPARWSRRGETTLLHTRIYDVTSVRYHHPVRDTEREFVVINPPDWVNILAVTPDHRLVLVNQFRYGIDAFSLEIPGGMMEAGEDVVTTGLRELREETGFTGSDARILGQVHPNPAIQSNRCHFVVVENAVRAGETAWDADEEIAVSTAPVEDVFAAARAGKITHALVLNALFFFEPVWNQLKAKRGQPTR